MDVKEGKICQNQNRILGLKKENCMNFKEKEYRSKGDILVLENRVTF